jgi:hypothetical protein
MAIELVGRPSALPADFHCPECQTNRPPYGFEMNGGDLGIVGMVQYFTVFCAAEKPRLEGVLPSVCGHIFAVQILKYMPPTDPALLAQFHQMLKGIGGTAS